MNPTGVARRAIPTATFAGAPPGHFKKWDTSVKRPGFSAMKSTSSSPKQTTVGIDEGRGVDFILKHRFGYLF
jgi:hypothetical protein